MNDQDPPWNQRFKTYKIMSAPRPGSMYERPGYGMLVAGLLFTAMVLLVGIGVCYAIMMAY